MSSTAAVETADYIAALAAEMATLAREADLELL